MQSSRIPCNPVTIYATIKTEGECYLLHTDSTIPSLLVGRTSLLCRLQVFNIEVQARWDPTMILQVRKHGYYQSKQVMRRVATSMQPDRQEPVTHLGHGKLEHFLVSSSSWSRSQYILI
jgi:hypothetical protein